MFTVVMRNSLGCELDRKEGPHLETILNDYADEGCLAHGDTLLILDSDCMDED